jgi:hypothetical protein
MPRSGGGIYSKPAGTTAVPNTVIESSKYNSTIDDIVTDLNAARPISAGGTGSTTAADARTALGISATNTPFTPTGAIAATNVQTALAELDSEKATASLYAPLAGATFTGAIAGTTATFTGIASAANATADGHLLNRITADARYLGDTYRNRIINPGMQISQERGTALVDVTTFSTYTVDQWQASLSTTPGGTLRAQQIASATPGGSPFRLRLTAQAADASIAAGDVYQMQQLIEGQMVADARFGTASARQIVLRFGVRSSLAGTFGVSLRNSAANRSYVTTITIAGGEINTDLVRTIVIPGDTSGTWLTDTGIGLALAITLSAGTTWHATAGSWQAGAFFTTSGQTNFMGTGSATFDIFDVGLYVDALAIGAAPSWELPAWDADLRACQRYYTSLIAQINYDGSTVGSATMVNNIALPTQMRVSPVASYANIAYTNSSNLLTNAIAATTLRTQATVTANGSAFVVYDVAMNARL